MEASVRSHTSVDLRVPMSPTTSAVVLPQLAGLSPTTATLTTVDLEYTLLDLTAAPALVATPPLALVALILLFLSRSQSSPYLPLLLSLFQ